MTHREDAWYDEIVEVVVNGSRVRMGRLEAIIASPGWPLTAEAMGSFVRLHPETLEDQ